MADAPAWGVSRRSRVGVWPGTYGAVWPRGHVGALPRGYVGALPRGHVRVKIAVGALVALLWIVFGVMANGGRQDVWQRAYLSASGTGRVIALDLSRNFDVLELTLRGVQDGLSFPGLGSLPLKDRNQVLYDHTASADYFANLFVMDDHGDLAVDSGGLVPRHANYADRAYFRYLRDHDTTEMYVNVPVYSKVGDGWTLPVAIRLNRPDGSFAGVAVGGLRMGYLDRLFQQVGLGTHDTISLVRTEGTLVARWPTRDDSLGKTVEFAPSIDRVSRGSQAWTTGESTFDGVDRLWVSSDVGKYPMLVTVGLATSDLMRDWYCRTGVSALSLLALTGLILMLTLRLTGELTRRERSEASLARQNVALDLSRQQFDSALDNMSQGLTFFDRNQNLVVCNRRYREIYLLSPDQTQAGATLLDILNQRVARGTFMDMSPADYLAERMAASRAAAPFDAEDQLSDGRTIALHHQPLPNGSWVTTHEDITERRRAEASLVFMAVHDMLTRLPNRILFRERLEQAIGMVGRGSGCAVLCLDLDRFKQVNDTLGHPVGDGLLRAAADRLRNCVHEVDTVARLGGDEFAIIQLAVTRPEEAEVLANRIIGALTKPFEVDGHPISVGASIGVALAPADGVTVEALLRNADLALYLAKMEGRGTERFFESALDARLQVRRQLETDLRDAIVHQEFEVYYQPLVNLVSGKITSFEALLRWHHPTRGLVSPLDFIPLSEETGLIVEIGEWVLRRACFEAENWPSDIGVAVNLSPVQFERGDLVAAVVAALDASGLHPSRLELEITESSVLKDSDRTRAMLHQFRAMAITVALDDFGTGYSSLSNLRSFPFDKIKIDQTFVRDLVEDAEAMAIIRAVTGLGRGLCIKTTAEGVETLEQLAELRAEGCNEVQGFIFSRPRPAHELPALIERLNTGATSLGNSRLDADGIIE